MKKISIIICMIMAMSLSAQVISTVVDSSYNLIQFDSAHIGYNGVNLKRDIISGIHARMYISAGNENPSPNDHEAIIYHQFSLPNSDSVQLKFTIFVLVNSMYPQITASTSNDGMNWTQVYQYQNTDAGGINPTSYVLPVVIHSLNMYNTNPFQYVRFDMTTINGQSAGNSTLGVENYEVINYSHNGAGIEQVASNNIEVNIYPNPNNGSFVIEPQNTLYNVHCTVYDVNGKAVLSQIINGKTSIDANSLNESIYNISLQSAEGVVNKRLVIVR